MTRDPVAHGLKTWPEYFAPLQSGAKMFEYRKDDRTPAFDVGDFLILREWRSYAMAPMPFASRGYTGHDIARRVTYVARGGLIPAGYCVMSLALLTADELANMPARILVA